MSRSKKTYEERIQELDRKEQESIENAKKFAAQRKELEKKQKAEEKKACTHRLCVIGGAVELVLGVPIEEEDVPQLISFLEMQERNGKYFSKAMAKTLPVPKTEAKIAKNEQENLQNPEYA